ncbi:hypothetical protein [Nocardioides daejeonensis]|uniref:hypothetical protein n=1 Tax=Nocardioides daejeonensis TaxID=1046556 RepID=UPI000D741AE2|nr:hypothetical protein [Nocardioides daejeonensis]
MATTLGHVGSRVSALVDGQLPSDQADRLWAHVHTCCLCRDRVEREGWVKTRVAGLSHQSRPAPDYLQSLLTLGSALETLPTTHDRHLDDAAARRRTAVAVVLGAGSVSAALVGVVALAGPAQTPVPSERRAPVASFTTPNGPAQPVSLTPSASTQVRGAGTTVGVGIADRWVTINP